MLGVLIEVPAAARHLGISASMVRRLLRERRLPGQKIGRRWLVFFNQPRTPGARGPKSKALI